LADTKKLIGLKETHMSFNSVWGFNPDPETKPQSLSSAEPETDAIAYTVAEQRAARIPSDVDSQVYELRRIYRL